MRTALLQPTAPSVNDDPIVGAVLEARGVSHSVNIRRGYFRHSKKLVLNAVGCRFDAGSLTAVLGPSGAGKKRSRAIRGCDGGRRCGLGCLCVIYP